MGVRDHSIIITIISICVMTASSAICGFLLAYNLLYVPPSILFVANTGPTISAPRGDSGCGSRGGPGFRLANGRCAAWDDVR